MKRHEWIRLVLCGFVAGVVWNLISVVSLSLVAPSLVASVQRGAWWLLKTLQSAKWAGSGFVEFGADLLQVGASTLAATVLAASAGAWLYRKTTESTPQRVPAT